MTEIVSENGLENEASKTVIKMAELKEIVITDYIRESLSKVADAEGFCDYELLVDHGSSIGDGFVGIMIKVTLRERNSDKSLQVLAKIPPTNPQTRAMMKSMKLFEREVFVYNILLPEFVALQKEKKISKEQGFFNFPKVFYADYDAERDDSIIIMEDMRNSGHRMWDKTKPVNLEHASLLMKALGRFHALSFAMKAKKPEQFQKYKELSDFISENFVEEQFMAFLVQSMDRALNMLAPDDTKARTKFKRLSDLAKQYIAEATTQDLIEPYGVV
jgi:hypothetical protein